MDVALGDMCSSCRVRIKGDPLAEGKVTQAWKGEKGRLIQGDSVEENKTWVQFFLHVAPTPPGSGVLGSLFTKCVSTAFPLHLGSICYILSPFYRSSNTPNMITFSFYGSHLMVVNLKSNRCLVVSISKLITN